MALIFYKNLKKHKKTEGKNITFSVFGEGVISNEDDLISKPNECKAFYNFSPLDGALKTGLGFKDLEVPSSESDLETVHPFNFSQKNITEIRTIDFFRYLDIDDDRYYYHLIIMDQLDQLWTLLLIDLVDGEPLTKSSYYFTDLISTCPYRIDDYDCLLYFTKTGMIFASAYQTEKFAEVPALLSCVVHYGKAFGITNKNRNELIYQSNLDIREWTGEAGSVIEFLDSMGAFTKLVVFNDYIYLFRENGITKISAYSSKDEFSFTHLYLSSSKIYEKSVCVCGEVIFFATRDGLFSFNGTSVSKICEEYDHFFKSLDNTNCSSCCLDGKYYLATKCDFEDDESVGCESSTFVNNVLFEVDIETKKVDVLRGVDIKKIISIDTPYFSKVVACFNGSNINKLGELVHNGKIFTATNAKSWSSFITDLGYKGKNKKIKEIILNTKYPCSVEIISDIESKTYSFDGSEKEQRTLASVNGRNFQFVFKTDEQNSHISKPMIVFDVIS